MVRCKEHFNILNSGLLMKPEHSETETRECKTKIVTETKMLLWDRDWKLRDRDQDQYDQFNYTWK